MTLNIVHHIAIIVSDYNLSKDFYVNKLGFSIIRDHIGVRPHKEKINISKEIINKTRRAVAPYAARMNHTPLRGEQ